MHSRLVQYHVRKLRQSVFRILDAPVANNAPVLLLIRLPESHLVDPASFLEHPLAEVEGLEHLHGPAGDAVRLPQLQRAVLVLHDAGADPGKHSQLRGQGQARGPAAHDEDVYFLKQCVRSLGDVDRGVLKVGITRLKAVQMELHVLLLSLGIVNS